MTRQQVIQELGDPDQGNEGELNPTANFSYFNLGFSVNLKNNVVHTISCFDPAGKEGPFKKAFLGRTKEGIGLASSREEIVRAYGEPTTPEVEPKTPEIEVLRYKPLGLFFMLKNGKVESRAVIFLSQKT